MNKGQVFSLDFIIAATVVLLGLTLTINAMETISYNSQEQLLQQELKLVAMTASDRFVTSAKPCTTLNNVKVKNCVYFNGTRISKQDLGIPDGFGYAVDSHQSNFSGTSNPGDNSVYSVTRVFLNSSNGSVSNSSVESITFRVWKE